MKIVDFGFARLYKPGNAPLSTPCFTLPYAAPEVLKQAAANQDKAGYDESCDHWSIGVILVSYRSYSVQAFTYQGPVVQSMVSLTSSLRGQLINFFMTS